jgi:hypothetical protein
VPTQSLVAIADLTTFIVRAKAQTYVGDGARSLSYRPGSHDIQFHEGEFIYLDSYFGGTDFIGQEVVYYHGNPVWAMNYYGRILDNTAINGAEAGKIIKASLTAMYAEGRFLGGFEYRVDDDLYVDTSEGDTASFTGKEWIMRRGQRVYELVYHGGRVKD